MSLTRRRVSNDNCVFGPVAPNLGLDTVFP